jgi:hypothetical protein
MTNKGRAGAAALLTAPLIVIASAIVIPTLSDKAGDRYAALSIHRQAFIAGSALDLIALAVLIGGTIWLALAAAPRASRLAFAGGALAVFGALVVMFENSIAAAMPAVVSGLDPAQAIAALQRVSSAGAITALEPVSILQDLGLALLGLAAVRAGAPRWAGVAMAVGAFAEGAGFGTATKGLVIAGFAILLVGLAAAVRTLLPQPVRGPAGGDSIATATGPEQALVELQQA